jgi:hypothetical protein
MKINAEVAPRKWGVEEIFASTKTSLYGYAISAVKKK